MIIDLPDTTTGAISRKIVELRETGGAVALGRVLTLIVPTEDGPPGEEAIRSSNDASREHPCRIIAVVRGNRRGSSRLDAQIRVGGDAGAGEVIVLRLYGPLAEHGDSVVVPFLLPDAPIVVWWPGDAPEVPVQDPIGRMAQRRITDASRSKSPGRTLQQRAAGHAPGDTDLAWSRITLWRGLLAAALDEPPYEPVATATVTGGADSPSTDLIAAWLTLYLKCPVKRVRAKPGTGMIGVDLERTSGAISLVRPDGTVATLTQPGQPVRRIALAPRQDRDCLAEELRRLDPDDVFGDVVTKGLALLARTGSTGAPKASPAGRGGRKSAVSTTPATPAPVTDPDAPLAGADGEVAAPPAGAGDGAAGGTGKRSAGKRAAAAKVTVNGSTGKEATGKRARTAGVRATGKAAGATS